MTHRAGASPPSDTNGRGARPAILVLLVMVEVGLLLFSFWSAAAADYPPVPATVRADLPSCLDPMTRATIPEAHLNSTIAAIKTMAGSRLEGVGPCTPGRVTVMLVPGSETLAQKIRTAYGRAILITVGLTPWNGHPGRSPRCGTLPSWTRPPKGLTFTLHLSSRTVRSGQSLRGVLEATNRGMTGFEMDTGSVIEGVLVRPGTHDVVGVYTGGIAGTGYALSADPGHTTSSKAAPTVLFGTGRCDGGIGSAVPPGAYKAVVLVMDEAGKAPRYLTSEVGVRVTSA